MSWFAANWICMQQRFFRVAFAHGISTILGRSAGRIYGSIIRKQFFAILDMRTMELFAETSFNVAEKKKISR
jgi:hypothetical protein